MLHSHLLQYGGLDLRLLYQTRSGDGSFQEELQNCSRTLSPSSQKLQTPLVLTYRIKVL